MTIGNIRRIAAVATALVVTLGSAMTAHAQKPTQKPGGAVTGKPQDKLDVMKSGMKARFGFSDAQADTVVKRTMAILETYKPKFKAIQAKYGNNPPMEVKIPVITEISKKTNAVILSVATKEQRPRVLAQMKREQAMLDRMTSGGGAPAKHP